MPAAKCYLPDHDAPLKRARPTSGWIGREPREYFVRAEWAENALDLATYCDYVLAGKIPVRHAGRVTHSEAELSGEPGTDVPRTHRD